MNIRVTYEEKVVKTYLFGLIKIRDYVLIEEKFIGDESPTEISFDQSLWQGKASNLEIKKENDE